MEVIVSLGNLESPPEDYCALICRDPNKFCVINPQQEVVEVIQRCLEIFGLDFNQESKGASSRVFRLNGHPFRRGGCSEAKTIKIKEL